MNLNKHTAVETAQSSLVKENQAALIALYKTQPEASIVIDKAGTRSKWSDVNNPMTAKLKMDKSETLVDVGVDISVGGDGKNSNPGDILCGALAACLDTSIRLVAHRLDLRLRTLNIDVEGKVDVRGALHIDKNVKIGFQSFSVLLEIETEHEVPEKRLDLLIRSAESSCVVMQTLLPTCDIVLRRKI